MMFLTNIKGRTVLVLLALIITAWPDLHAQGMVIQTKGGASSVEMLDLIESLRFTEQFIVVDNSNSTTHAYDMRTISKIIFDPVASERMEELASGKFLVYPNPASDHIRIGNPPPEGTSVQVFSLQGVKVLEYMITSTDTEIDISQLSTGMYVIKMNGQAGRFVKQ